MPFLQWWSSLSPSFAFGVGVILVLVIVALTDVLAEFARALRR